MNYLVLMAHGDYVLLSVFLYSANYK